MKTDHNYERLALFYDLLMQGIDYEAWVSYIEEIIEKYRGHVTTVADLACGTGNSSLPWAAKDYHTCGVDLSAEMLEIAKAKASARGLEIAFYQQDLCHLQLDHHVDLAVCFQDGFNYILSIEALRKAFRAVYNNLTKDGFFIFDLNYLPRIAPSNQAVSLIQEERFSLCWSARFQEEERLWEVEVSGTINDQEDGRRDYYEKHREKIYEPIEVWSLLTGWGFTILNSYQAFTFEQPHDQTPRIVYVAQKI